MFFTVSCKRNTNINNNAITYPRQIIIPTCPSRSAPQIHRHCINVLWQHLIPRWKSRDFLTFFQHRCQVIFPTDLHANWLKRRKWFTQGCAYCCKKIDTFIPPDVQAPQKLSSKFGNFLSSENFRSISCWTIEVSRENILYSSLKPNKSDLCIGKLGWQINICT